MRTFTGALLVAWSVGGCGTAGPVAPPQAPAEAAAPPVHAPTGLDLLLEHRDALDLTFNQQKKLQALHDELEKKNGPLQKQLDALEQAPPAAASEGEGHRPGGGVGAGGGHHGGGGGRMGGRGGGGRGGGGRGAGPPAGGAESPRHAQAKQRTESADAVLAEMAANHGALLREALNLLDDAQRKRARQLLDENDYEFPETKPGPPPTDTHVGEEGQR